MKKNILSILILVLQVVNIALTAVMMLSVTGASQKTSNLVTQIASILEIELKEPGVQEEVPIEDIATYNMEGELTILLKRGEDGKDHYCLLKSVSLVMDTKADGYKKYGTSIQDSLIRDIIIGTVGEYTIDEFRDNVDDVKQEIVKRIQMMYGSEFVFKVAFGDYQCS